MANLLYLLLVIAVSVTTCGILVFRNRRPRSMEAGMREFQRGLQALDPNSETRRAVRPPARGARPGRSSYRFSTAPVLLDETEQSQRPPSRSTARVEGELVPASRKRQHPG